MAAKPNDISTAAEDRSGVQSEVQASEVVFPRSNNSDTGDEDMRTKLMVAVTATLLSAGNLQAQRPDEFYLAAGTTCSNVDVSAAQSVQIKTDKYDSTTMISPDSAKVLALCAVPGQIGSGEMNLKNGRTEYAIDIIPNGKKTHTKVIIDAHTGAVLSSKQFGGLRGVAGWMRESAEHKKNAKP